MEDFDLEGLDATWNSNKDEEESDAEELPQYDGPADNKNNSMYLFI